MVHTKLNSSSIPASRRARRTFVGAVLIAGASCVPGRPTPPASTPVARATPRPDSTRLAARPDSAAPAPTPPRRNPFEGADLSPKPPVLPLSPSDEQKHFLLQPGYHMTPVLTEPAIQQPATISFDGNGRMFVLELRTYMLDADARDQLAPVSRISRWEDRNNDGVYETHTVFVDSLVFPRFATPYGADAV
ncbi:MAG: hypothetical protein JF589_18045, partial [Gemmatimonadetes bacterium]|nr:hypothetical protein [Gemmatimonadota bacterium]